MNRLIWFFVILILLVPIFANAAPLPVNGYLHAVDNQRVLHVWGSYYEMGYAHGYLLGDEIMKVFHEYILNLLPVAIYKAGHWAVPPLFEVPDQFMAEFTGILDGIRDSGADPFIYPLNRDMDIGDLIFSNAVADLGAMACSSLMTWGPGTADDPRLGGEVALVRNLDWPTAGPDPFLLPKSTIVMVFSPTVPDEQTVAMVSFPGFTGCLSGINDEGVTAALNIAHNGVGLLHVDYLKRFEHIGLTIREALAKNDITGDGKSTIDDVIKNIDDNIRSGAIVVNLAQPLNAGQGDPAVIVEIDNKGVALRTPQDEPEFTDYVLAATNHLRKLHEPTDCWRYDLIRDEVTAVNGHMTMDLMYEIQQSVIQDYFLSVTVQTMYFLPHEREMGVAFTDENEYSADKEPSVLTWDEITAYPPWAVIDDDDEDDPDIDDDDADENPESDKGSNCCG